MRRGERPRATAAAPNIAQGSALSPLVGEMVMADILRGLTVPLGAFAVAYSDNIGIIVSSGGESDLEEHLRAAFASHGAGPFEIKSSASRLTRPFKFLGYWWDVSDAGPRAFIRETEAITWEIAVTSNAMVASRRKLDRIEDYVRGKCAAWALWDAVALLRDRVLANISALRELTTYHDDGAEEADVGFDFDADWEFE